LVDPGTGEDLGIPLLGIADLILDGDEGADIVDFKTSSRSAPPFEISHEVQLTSYAYLFRRTTGQEEVGLEIHSLIKTKTPKIEIHRYPNRSSPQPVLSITSLAPSITAGTLLQTVTTGQTSEKRPEALTIARECWSQSCER
jgi:hypothetical protein